MRCNKIRNIYFITIYHICVSSNGEQQDRSPALDVQQDRSPALDLFHLSLAFFVNLRYIIKNFKTT